MANHRYWRVNFTASTSGSTIQVRFYEIEFRGTIGGVDQCNGGTASASHNTSTANLAFNNSAGDQWNNGGPSVPSWIQYDFGAGVTVDVAEIMFQPYNASQCPTAFDIQYSDDGTSFTTKASWSLITSGWQSGTQRTFAVPPEGYTPPAGSHRFWRLNITQSNSGTSMNISLYEVEMRGSVGGVDQCVYGVPSTLHSSSLAYMLFDDDYTTNYWGNGSPAQTSWIVYDFGAGHAVKVAQFGIWPYGTTNTPKAFTLDYSDDGSTWTTKDSWSGLTTGWTSGVGRLFATSLPPSIVNQWSLTYAVLALVARQWELPEAITSPVAKQWDEGWSLVQVIMADRQWTQGYSQTTTQQWTLPIAFSVERQWEENFVWLSLGQSWGFPFDLLPMAQTWDLPYGLLVERQWNGPWGGWVEQAWECPVDYSPYQPKSDFAIFPLLPGLSWESKKTPEFRTSIQTASSGREQRGAFRAYPVWRFTLLFDWLRAGNPCYEYETLQGFILGRRGSFESFLFLDPTDSICTDMPFGVGDGVQTAFQLTRAFGFHGSFSFTEPVENIKTLTIIRVNGVALSAPGDYAISATGLVTFTAPPVVGAVITWSGAFYFRCRFGEDTADFARTLPNLWELRELTFIGAPGNKI
ncbi:MAG: DUF2460 domain-containing protein [Magnetococcales bacterium]|nr:DUF2460 domain-containing protein [Magnetococcales bacterium]